MKNVSKGGVAKVTWPTF